MFLQYPKYNIIQNSLSHNYNYKQKCLCRKHIRPNRKWTKFRVGEIQNTRVLRISLGLRPREIIWAQGHISLYIPPLILIRIQYTDFITWYLEQEEGHTDKYCLNTREFLGLTPQGNYEGLRLNLKKKKFRIYPVIINSGSY